MRRSPLLGTQFGLNSEFEESDLDDREREVLRFLSNNENGYYSFQGLRRRLGFHQETLTRTLRRLEEARVIERSADGYKLKGSAHAYSFTVPTGETLQKPIIDAYLPAQIDVTILFQKLRGRWFSNFRWLGYSHDGNRLSMSWISEDGRTELQARIGHGKIAVMVNSPSNLVEAQQIAAAYQLFDHISKVAEEMVHSTAQAPIAN